MDVDNDVDDEDFNAGGVCIALSPTEAALAILGTGSRGFAWEEYFIDDDPGNDWSKPSIASALLIGDTEKLAAFASYYRDSFSVLHNGSLSSGKLVNFTYASDGGDVEAQAIPEPSIVLALGIGMAALPLLRKRNG